MSQLEEKLNHIKITTKMLLDEIEKLTNDISELEQYNQRLIYENQQLQEVVASATKVAKPNRASNALLEMYERGYHICTESFSKPLDDTKGCLFCDQVIERNKG